jgi:hypothetical protein
MAAQTPRLRRSAAGDRFADPIPTVVATFDDGARKELFGFYPDEITFGEGELVGLTEAEARAVRQAKDVAYLRAP